MTDTRLTIMQPDTGLVLSSPISPDKHPAAVYLAGLGNDRSRRVQRQALELIAGLLTGNPDALACDWAALRNSHMVAIRSILAERYSAASANRMLSAARGVLRAAFANGQMSAEDYQRAIMIKPVEGETLPAGRGLTSGEIKALVEACEQDTTPAGARDCAIIGIMYNAGPRRVEVVDLDLADLDPEKLGLKIRKGKGNKQRMIYLENGAARALADWLQIRGSDPGALFYPITKSGALQPRRMTSQALYNMLRKRATQAGVSEFSPHDLRRTFISDMLDAGADISTVAKMAGHADTRTTGRYDRRADAVKQKAAGLLHFPYSGRK